MWYSTDVSHSSCSNHYGTITVRKFFVLHVHDDSCGMLLSDLEISIICCKVIAKNGRCIKRGKGTLHVAVGCLFD